MNSALFLDKLENLYVMPVEINYPYLVRGMKLELITIVSPDLSPAEWFAFPGQNAGGLVTWSMALLLIFQTCNHASPLPAAAACDFGRVGALLLQDG